MFENEVYEVESLLLLKRFQLYFTTPDEENLAASYTLWLFYITYQMSFWVVE